MLAKGDDDTKESLGIEGALETETAISRPQHPSRSQLKSPKAPYPDFVSKSVALTEEHRMNESKVTDN